MPRKKQITFQQSMERLEEIVLAMEQSAISIEESLALYKEGIQLSVHCGQYLNTMEQEVQLLSEDAKGIFELTPFLKNQQEEEESF